MPNLNLYYTLSLLLFLVVLAALFLRYVSGTLDGEFRRLARSATDAAFRQSELARVNGLLASRLPLPPGEPPLAKPKAGWTAVLPPGLMTVAVALLWGSAVAVPSERGRWLYGAAAAAAAAFAGLALTLPRRKRRTTARLLRHRADLRRLDGDAAGAAADLRILLALTPWDDAAWAELADDLAGLAAFPAAFAAAGEAARLDPDYDEYRLLPLSLALRMGDAARARAALTEWEGTPPARPGQTAALYRAAVALAEGRRDRAAAELSGLDLDLDGADGGYLAAAPELAGVLDLMAEAPERQDARQNTGQDAERPE